MRPRTSTLRPKKKLPHTPQRHNLDRHAAKIDADAPGKDDEDLLTTKQVAEWFRVSEQWLEIGRGKNYGPEFEQMGPRIIRYQRGKCREWLKERSYSCTSEYPAEARRKDASLARA
jgi:hypothetical protein